MPIEYNPMTGHRTDLDVDKEDGKKADETHARWVALRIAYLTALLASELSADARTAYEREVATL